MTVRARVLLFLAAAVVTSVFFIDFCNLVYRCGCRSLWAGADAYCNIHVRGVKHCPWCSIGTAGGVAVWSAIVASQAAVCFGMTRLSLVASCIVTFSTFPLVGGVLALATGLWLGYWA
jgi:hypothetical protein